MKYYYILLLLLAGLLLSSHSMAQGSLAALDAKNGFRDAKFGMTRAQLKGMVLYKGDDFGNYIRPADRKMIGDIPLRTIRYRFHKGVLYSLFIVIDSRYKDQILETFRIAYGPGRNSPKLAGFQNWKGKKIELSISHTTIAGIRALHIEMSNNYLTLLSNQENMDQENAIEHKMEQKRQSDL